MAEEPTVPRMMRLRVGLVGIDPEIWREIEVGDWLTLGHLHQVLQVAFGWQNAHLHKFTEEDPWVPRPADGIPRIGPEPREWIDQWSLMEDDQGEEDEAEVTLADAFDRGGPIWYEYDFGDGWVHRIDVIDSRPAKKTDTVVRILDGARRAPLEDSGGIAEYAEKLAIMADPKHPDHEFVTAWVRSVVGPWGSADPEDADLDGARDELALLIGPPTADMSGLVDASQGITDDSPIVQFAANLPVPFRTGLRRHLRRTGILDPVMIDAKAAAAVVKPYSWLVARVGDEGMPLSKAGWMPPAVVTAAVDELGWREGLWGTGTREQHTRPVARLRETATGLRLIRKYKGRLEVVSRTRAVADDPQALYAQVAHALLRQRMDEPARIASVVLMLGLADGTITTEADAEERAAEVLDWFGYVVADDPPWSSAWLYLTSRPVMTVLETLGLWDISVFRTEAHSGALREFARMTLR